MIVYDIYIYICIPYMWFLWVMFFPIKRRGFKNTVPMDGCDGLMGSMMVYVHIIHLVKL